MKIITNSAISIFVKINTRDKLPKSLGSKNDLKRLLQIRNRADAILIGGQTYRNHPFPSLSEYLISGKRKKPIWNVVLTRKEKFTFSKKFEREPRVRTLALCGSSMTPRQIVKKLEPLGIKTLLIEGGGDIIGQFLKKNLIDEIYATLCPLIIGSKSAPSIAKNPGTVKKLRLIKRQVKNHEIFFHFGL